MATYQGDIQTYALNVQTPNNPTNYKNVIYLKGSFGLAFLYFVPENGILGANGIRAGQKVFDVYYWMGAWSQITDLLRNETPCRFFYDSSNNTAVVATGDEPVGEEELK